MGSGNCHSCPVEKAEDLRLLHAYLIQVISAIRKGGDLPDFVAGFNDCDILDCFCSLCEEIERLRKRDG